VTYHCCDRLRRNATAAHATLNGLDYLEVLDRDLPETHEFRQRTLLLHFLKPFTGLSRDNLRLTGGDRIKDVQIEWADAGQPAPPALTPEETSLLTALPDADRVLVVRTKSTGDRSAYRLRLVRSPTDDLPPDDFDPQLIEIAFSFKVECPSDFDCAPRRDCPPDETAAPDLDYLAKDYASLRRLLLDRLRRLVPDWQGRSPADLGVTLVELLARAGDHLSYEQDAAVTEAHFGTARRRVSVRRHAVLVDYAMDDGCTARAWVHVQVAGPAVTLPKAGTQFLTRCAGVPVVLPPASTALHRAMEQRPIVFEPLHDATLHAAHNEIFLYTWGDQQCCLPRGATHATLSGHLPDLTAGSCLLFEERLGPHTGAPGDADPTHRHVVRLTNVRCFDANNAPLVDPLPQATPEITEVDWADDDALPFPLCVSAVVANETGSSPVANVSIARGNLILADHGRTLSGEATRKVPPPHLFTAPPASASRCDGRPPVPVPPRFRPALTHGPVTQAGGVWIEVDDAGQPRRERAAFDPQAPAARAFQWEMRDVWPEIALVGTLDGESSAWTPRRTLLNSAAAAREFVAEVDDDGTTWLRFGDDHLGRRPDAGTGFVATYRVGNGAAGNVGAEALSHIVTSEDVEVVRNPLSAAGGVDPEPIASARRRAPQAFRRQERAVTPADYAEVTRRHSGIQNTAATLRWTGAWHTVFITVDRAGGAPLTTDVRTSLARHVNRYRMAGHDAAFREPVFVPLELALHVCVKPDWFRTDVKRALLERLGSRALPGGGRGLFHPDSLTFGDTVHLSRIYAEARQVPGVDSAVVTAFRRQYSSDEVALAEGRIALDRLEIPRLDNDPNHPERGVITLDLHGGK
jgi:hypothetical protein